MVKHISALLYVFALSSFSSVKVVTYFRSHSPLPLPSALGPCTQPFAHLKALRTGLRYVSRNLESSMRQSIYDPSKSPSSPSLPWFSSQVAPASKFLKGRFNSCSGRACVRVLEATIHWYGVNLRGEHEEFRSPVVTFRSFCHFW
jgi:hypothetical protein